MVGWSTTFASSHVSYEAASPCTAFIEPVGLGDELPDMPLFIAAGLHITVPLATTYATTWELLPADLRAAVANEAPSGAEG